MNKEKHSNIKVVITGATGMVGEGVLNEWFLQGRWLVDTIDKVHCPKVYLFIEGIGKGNDQFCNNGIRKTNS